MENNIEKLFNGIAVVIDDEIGDTKSVIYKIIEQIKAKNIPILKYTELPEEDVEHFQNLSFLILDWHLKIEEGVLIPPELIINFINRINKICFCPIFIFTNKKEEVKEVLKNNGLYNQKKLLLKDKADLIGNKNIFFSVVTKWLENTPSIYVLKEWDREYRDSKNKLFSDFYNMSPKWPCIMWENFIDDAPNNKNYKSLAMGELISKNLYSRMSPFQFEDSILNNKITSEEKDIINVLEGERYLRKERINPEYINAGESIGTVEDIGTGDIFNDNGKYYLNIRAKCDLVRCDNPELYLLLGEKIYRDGKPPKKDKITFDNGKITFKNGNFHEEISYAIIPFIDGNNIIKFSFKEFIIVKWKDYKEKRIGRILPPHIDRIQQRFAFYMQRQGVPRIPSEAIKLLATATINENS